MGPLVFDELLPVLPCPDGHHHSGDMVHGKWRFLTVYHPLIRPVYFRLWPQNVTRAPGCDRTSCRWVWSEEKRSSLLLLFFCFSALICHFEQCPLLNIKTTRWSCSLCSLGFNRDNTWVYTVILMYLIFYIISWDSQFAPMLVSFHFGWFLLLLLWWNVKPSAVNPRLIRPTLEQVIYRVTSLFWPWGSPEVLNIVQ